MTEAEAHTLVIDRLGDIAPEADLEALADDADLREELDLDSMDALTLLEELSEAIGADIPNEVAADLRTVGELTAYVASVTG